jgi:type I restriction enzyme M protein
LLRKYNPAAKKTQNKVISKLELTRSSGISSGAALFYSTGIPVCILVLKKCKKPDDVLFINASEHFERGKRQNRLQDKDIEKIVETYQFRKEEQRYSKRIPMEQL